MKDYNNLYYTSTECLVKHTKSVMKLKILSHADFITEELERDWFGSRANMNGWIETLMMVNR